MKKAYCIAVFLTFMQCVTSLHACPTCVAKVEANTPPFFSDDFYYQKPHEEDLVQEKEKKSEPNTP